MLFRSNIHNILDWRLGLDLARLANDSNSYIGFSNEYWLGYINQTVINKIWSQGYKVIKKSNDVIILSLGEKHYILAHPLWSNKFIEHINDDHNLSYCGLKSVYDLMKE